MLFNTSDCGVANDAACGGAHDADLMAEMLEPRLTERPPTRAAIRVPRSAQRTYSPAEIWLAADLLGKLRRREDGPPPPARFTCDAEWALDVAADRLLDLL